MLWCYHWSQILLYKLDLLLLLLTWQSPLLSDGDPLCVLNKILSPLNEWLRCPSVRLISLTPRMMMLHISISLTIWAVLPVSYIVCAFPAATLTYWLGFTKDSTGVETYFQFSCLLFIQGIAVSALSSSAKIFCLSEDATGISAARNFVKLRVASPMHNPPPFSA